MRSTTLDCSAPAKSDHAPALMVSAGLGDSMAAARVYRRDPTLRVPTTASDPGSSPVTMRQWHKVMAC